MTMLRQSQEKNADNIIKTNDRSELRTKKKTIEDERGRGLEMCLPSYSVYSVGCCRW